MFSYANWANNILTAVETFDSRPLYPAIDFAVYQIFQIPVEGKDRQRLLMARIEAIEYLFQAGLRRRGIAKDKILSLADERSEFAGYYWRLVRDIPLGYELSASSREDIVARFEATVSRLKEQLGIPDAKRSSAGLAFASKLLHWTFRNAFPMTDSRSKKGISRMSREMGLRFKRNEISGRMPEYDKVSRFYLEVKKKLDEGKQLDVLLKKDEEHLPAGLKARYSWLRVLDKAMWMLGGDDS